MAETTQDQDQDQDQSSTPTKVTISSPGVSVQIESHAPLDVVAAKAEQVHRAAVERYGSLPPGFGGAL